MVTEKAGDTFEQKLLCTLQVIFDSFN